MTTLVKTTPLRRLAPGLNGPVLCHRGKFFQKAVMCSCGDGANSSWLFILRSVMQVLLGGQLTVNHLLSLFSEWGGGARLWWMMLRCFQLLTWETGPYRELSRDVPHKSMSIWPVNIAAKAYLCIIGFIAGYEHVQVDSPAWMHSVSVEQGLC